MIENASIDAVLSEIKALRDELAELRREMKIKDRPFLTVSELARELNLSEKTVRNKRSLGTLGIPSTQRGGRILFRREDLDKYWSGN